MKVRFACMPKSVTLLVIVASGIVSSCQQTPLTPYRAAEIMDITVSGSSSTQPLVQVRIAFLTNSAAEEPRETLYLYDLSTKTLRELASFVDVEGGRVSWSPNGHSLAVAHGWRSWNKVFVGDTDGGEFIELDYCSHWGGLTGWTLDGHYAILDCGDQYGNNYASVFDTDTWERVVVTSEGCPPFGTCRRGVAKISTIIMLTDGSRVDLPKATDGGAVSQRGSQNSCGDIQESMSEDISVTCWSPDRALLAASETNVLRVYDGEYHVLHSLSITGTISSIAWSQVP